MLTSAKAFETTEAIRLGAEEIDTVINIGAVKDGNYSLVYDDISSSRCRGQESYRKSNH
jgi:deoxyribose-phosphate aldolase